MKGLGGLGGGGRWLGRGGKGYQDSQIIFLISYTVQYVIVEMALVPESSVCSFCQMHSPHEK